MKPTIAIGGALVAALAVQVSFAAALHDVRPQLAIIPPPPTEQAWRAASFGDSQFLYRRLALDVQNFGDTGGRVTPLKDYDMSRVVGWLHVLGRLDPKADYHMVLASRYFAQTQDTPQLVHLIDYIRRQVERDPERGLQWLPEAIFMAGQLGDRALTLSLADQLGGYDFPAMTVVAYQLPAILHAQAGEYAQALRYMERAQRLAAAEASPQDLAYMDDFVAEMQQLVKVEDVDS